ncbi:MAG TPA: sigma 54-interacting transcriptional regulator [Polyangiaceae bacterium]|jgi:DNA-binding NtrC family response regulator
MTGARTTETVTARTDGDAAEESQQASPGLLLLYGADAPRAHAFPLGRSRTWTLGRHGTALVAPDPGLSRAHVELRHEDSGWTIRDLGSRNGTFLDGERVMGATRASSGAIVRASKSLFLLVDDTRAYRGGVTDEGCVLGAAMREVFRRLAHTAAAGRDLLVTGETGTGKELAARAFHAATPRASKPMVCVNCANLPEGLAERLLFGARRGTYSGATSDSEGLLAEADGSTLFLDEVGELDVRVQAKLLRFLEAREVLPLGATQTRKVSVQIVFATHRDPWRAVPEGRLREDFVQRIVRPRLELPPLRARREEIPWHVASTLRHDGRGLSPHHELIEACVRHPWPGNVRALVREIQTAIDAAVFEGVDVVRVKHLTEIAPSRAPGERASIPPERGSVPPEPGPRELEEALSAHAGNLAATARALGLHRRHLYRMLARHGLVRGSA